MSSSAKSSEEIETIQSIVLLSFESDYGAVGDSDEEMRYLEGEISVSDFRSDTDLRFVRYVLRCGRHGSRKLPGVNIQAVYGTLQPRVDDEQVMQAQVKRAGMLYLWPQFAALFGAVSYQMRNDLPPLPPSIQDIPWTVTVSDTVTEV